MSGYIEQDKIELALSPPVEGELRPLLFTGQDEGHPFVNLALTLHDHNRNLSRSHGSTMVITDEKLLAALQRYIPTFKVQPTADDVLALAIAIAAQHENLHQSLDFLLSTYPGIDMYGTPQYPDLSPFVRQHLHVSHNTIYEAALNGGKDIIRVLLKHGLDTNKQLSFPGWNRTETQTMFHAICSSCPDAIDLLDHPDTTQLDSDGNTGQYYLLSKDGSKNYITRLYERTHFDVNARYPDGLTLLETAIKNRKMVSINTICQLIQCGADVCLRNSQTSDTILHYALSCGMTNFQIEADIAKLRGWNFEITPDHIDRYQRRSQLIGVLLEHRDIDINARNSLGETALMMAASNGDYESVNLLLGRAYIDKKSRDIYGRTALQRAQLALIVADATMVSAIQVMIDALAI